MRDKHGSVAFTHALPGDQSHNPDMCPEVCWQHFVLQCDAQPTKPHWLGLFLNLHWGYFSSLSENMLCSNTALMMLEKHKIMCQKEVNCYKYQNLNRIALKG